MDDDTAALYGKINMHEFLIEILLAREMANLAPDDADLLKSEILRISRLAYGAEELPDNDYVKLAEAFHASLNNLLDKAHSRSAELRVADPRKRLC